MRHIWVLSSIVLAACASTSPPSAKAQSLKHDDTASVLALIWPKEEAIYKGRAAGDANAYYSSTAKGYLSWPPMTAAPIRSQSLRPQGTPKPSAEKIELTFKDLTVQGDTAVIYYSTHRTMTADGTPVDQRFEVTHTWVLEGGDWKMLGGMGRSMPAR